MKTIFFIVIVLISFGTVFFFTKKSKDHKKMERVQKRSLKVPDAATKRSTSNKSLSIDYSQYEIPAYIRRGVKLDWDTPKRVTSQIVTAFDAVVDAAINAIDDGIQDQHRDHNVNFEVIA